MLLQNGQTGDGGGHKGIMPGGVAMGRTNKATLTLLILSMLWVAARGLTARNAAWDTKTGRFEGDDRLA